MRRTTLLSLALVVTAGALLAAPALGAKDDVILISRATGPTGAPGDLFSSTPSISANGDRVAFTSSATNLSPEDTPGASIFVREAGSNVTTLASRVSGAGGAAADDDSEDPAISGDGRYVAFGSDADNLSTEDDNGVGNIFVRDLVANTTILVSRATGAGGAAANGGSAHPTISRDGRYVAFESDGNNLSGADDNAVRNLFVRDLVANTTVFVSRRSGANGAGGNDLSFAPAISADGTRVAFASRAEQPLKRGRQRLPQRLRPRPDRGDYDAHQPRHRRRRRPRGRRRVELRRDLSLRPLRRVHVGGRQPLGRRRQRHDRHLPARPRRVHHRSREPGERRARSRRGRQFLVPLRLRQRPRGLQLDGHQPLGR